MKQPKRSRLWFNDRSCVRLRALKPNHVWSYDFVHDQTYDGKAYRTLNILDEYTRECLAIRVDRKLNIRGFPEYIRSDNGPEFVAKSVRNWSSAVGAKTAYTEPGSPWENGYCESFNAGFRDEFLNGEIFYTLKEAEILIEQWPVHYNTFRSHSSLNWKPSAPESMFQVEPISMMN